MGQSKTVRLVVIATLNVLNATLSLSQFIPRASLYSALAGSGSFVLVPPGNDPIPNLAAVGFDNKAKSTCLLGIWLFYDKENFNVAGNDAMEYIFEPKFTCVNFATIGGYVSSLRSVGIWNDYSADTITFYANIYFQGDTELILNHKPHLRLYNRVASLVITGVSDWTIYDEPNFDGRGICLKIYPTSEYAPSFIPDLVTLNPTIPRGSIASVRKGCYTEKIIRIKSSSSSVTDAVRQETTTPEMIFPFHFVLPFFTQNSSSFYE